MESRRLLAGDLGAVAGNVFTDLNDDGMLDAGDTPISAAQVFLYRDGGNGTFDSDQGVAGGDDILETSDTTDANGDYRFDQLGEGLYFVEQEAVSGVLQRDSETVRTVELTANDVNGTPTITVDNASVDQAEITAIPGMTASSQVSDGAGDDDIIGDQRDVVIVNDSDLVNGGNLSFEAAGGVMRISAQSVTTGQAIITYDGVDADADGNANGLNLDLTQNGGEAMHFRVGSSQVQERSELTVRVFSGNDVSTITREIEFTQNGDAIADLVLAFSDFSAGADFSNVTAIQLEVDLVSADDVRIDFVNVVAVNEVTEDFANLLPMALGDFVFHDLDDDGIQDAGEEGIAGVTVELYEDDGSGSFEPANDTFLTSVTTDANGIYFFENLFPGDYIPVIPASQFTGGNPLEDFVTSSNDPAPDPNNNDNTDDNGTFIAGVGVASLAMNLAAGQEINDGDDDPNRNPSLDFGFVAQVDLSVTKTADESSVTAGDTLTYTVVVTNESSADATNVVVVDDLPNLSPENLTIVSATTVSGNGTITIDGPANGEITATFATLAADASETLLIEVEIPAGATETVGIDNVATVSATEPDNNTENNEATATVSITRQATLTITKTDSPDPNTVGGALAYEIVVTNTGPSTANNVVVTDQLAAGLTFVNATSDKNDASITQANGLVTAELQTLEVGVPVTITINTTINDDFAGSTIPNSAAVNADESQTVTAQADTTVNPSIELIISKMDDPDPATREQQLVYTLEVTNEGPSAATDVTVTDTLPEGVTYVSASGGTIVSEPSGSDRDVVIDLGTLQSGDTSTISITVNVNNDAPETLTNSAEVTSTETEAGFEPNETNNSVSESTTLNPLVDLVVEKSDNPDPVVAGDLLTYSVLVTNDGPSAATNVDFTDTLPADVTFVSANSSQGSVSESSGVVSGNLGTINPGTSATVTIQVRVDADARNTLSNRAEATADEPEANAQDNVDIEETTVNATVDVSITKDDDVTTVAPGSPLVYTLEVTNTGPSTATGVVVTDNLPSDLTFVSGTSTVGTVSNTGNAVTVNVGTLAPNATAVITLNTTVNADVDGDISNTASVAVTETDSNTGNNSATHSTSLRQLATLAGTVFHDINRNNLQDANEPGLANVTMTLQGTGDDIVVQTDADGNYLFEDLDPGTYDLLQSQPAGFDGGLAIPGEGADDPGEAGTNQITSIELGSGNTAEGFDFSEIIVLSKRRLLARG